MKKKLFALALTAIVGAALLTACGSSSSSDSADSASASATQEPSNELNSTTEITGDKEILVVSFGTSYNESREETIGAIESSIADAFPGYSVQRAFTSQIIIDKLSDRDGLQIDNVEEALERAADAGVKTLVVQPTHLMNGYEYTDLSETLDQYTDRFDKVVLGDPLLTSDADFEAVAAAITESTKSNDDGSTAICFMGHGTEADSNSVYSRLQNVLIDNGFDHYFIGTVEAEPSLDDVIDTVKTNSAYKKVVLQPLMVVAGDHANNDMAGDEEDSWKSRFEAEGYQVDCILKGLGSLQSIRDIYVQHVSNAISAL